MTPKFRPWAPAIELRQIWTACDAPARALVERLGTDERGKAFWQWLDKANDAQEARGSLVELEATMVWHTINRGLQLPQKPGDMAPSQRQKYLDQVNEAAAHLQQLLNATRFDMALPDEWARLRSDYPMCTLTAQLDQLVDWTQQPDWHDRDGRPAWMIKHKGTPARKNFLLSALREQFDWFGCWPNWGDLAGLVNVVLDLDESDEANEDAVRRIIERQRQAKPIPTPGRERNMADLVTDRLMEKD